MYDANGYLGFTFAGRHSSEFGLLVVSDGSRYHQNSYNQFSDSVITVPGKSGGYYFGTQLSQRDFEINCVFDNITPHMMHKIQHWLYPNVMGWIIFDEQPYKKYFVKLSSVPQFNFIPFDNFEKIYDYTFQKETLKGEVNFSFYTIEEYGILNSDYELPEIKEGEIIPQYAIDSGILPKNYNRTNIFLPHEKIYSLNSRNLMPESVFCLYNSGNGIAKADFHFTVSKRNVKWPLEILNYNDGTIYRINNPEETLKKELGNNYDLIYFYQIEILGRRQEVYLLGLNLNKEKIQNVKKVNIGGSYNQFYPKVYHNKPTEVCIFSQVLGDDNIPEPLYYTYSYDLTDFESTDEKQSIKAFEEFQKYWEDYMIISKNSTLEVNYMISPAVIFADYVPQRPNRLGDHLINKELTYLIYPNKYEANNELIDFIAEYDHTYI